MKTTEAISRRYFFSECGVGVGKVALASLLGHGVAREASGGITSGNPLAPRPSHHAPKAKRVIFLFMAGGPSHIDLFDHKPALRKYDGEEVPAEVLEGQELPFIERDAALMSSPFTFSRHGNSAAELSEALTHLPQVVDDIAFVKSIHTDAFNHAPAQIFMNTGHLQLGKPSVGAWVTYGLGSECENLPAFVTLASGRISGGAACYGCGFLPSVYQGVQFRAQGEPILFVNNPSGFDRKMQRDTLHAIGKLNRQRLDVVGDPEIAGRINSYELAFRMQASAPELTDLRQERKETLELYGAELGKSSFANSCLLARRLVERGVRFVEVFHSGWDHHSNVVGNVKRQCAITDRATTALILDLKRRGLLDDTLVIWGGEFGRTPMVENNPALGRKRGRDHHPNAFTMWLAGGGIKPGQTIGRTDDLGYHIVEDPVHVHDLQATLLHLLGLDHTKLTFRHQGRDFRLTDVGGEVVSKLLA